MRYPHPVISWIKIFLDREKLVHDKAWTVRIRVVPTFEYLGQSYKKSCKKCSTGNWRIVLCQSTRWHFQNFSRRIIPALPKVPFLGRGGGSNHWIPTRALGQSKSRLLRKSDPTATKLLHANAQSFKSDTSLCTVFFL